MYVAMNINMKGTIDVAIGPMWAEKTTYAISRLRKAEIVGKSALIILYSEDDRYGTEGIITHSGIIYKGADVDRMNSISPEKCKEIAANYSLVVIDEGQFFENVAESAQLLSSEGCDVVVTCLSGDFEQKMFPEVSKLIPYASKIHHFRAICMKCKKNKAPHNIRLDKNNSEQKDIGGADKYMSVCGSCL
jgi:thymidine kinase